MTVPHKKVGGVLVATQVEDVVEVDVVSRAGVVR